ncbi:MAG: hypothetical protein MK175_20140 [Pseudoalteromonas sp.]|uniref:hypothetical protein n=1 Tax=Pseudoalteromonas sp. TaxID=53249 RepID=UPI0025DEF23B|nr:hypothetical protein [Pseudoalteromonas sp.]MCH2089499.1 hypothetical protein [Pseudoalteromonas sp.]
MKIKIMLLLLLTVGSAYGFKDTYIADLDYEKEPFVKHFEEIKGFYQPKKVSGGHRFRVVQDLWWELAIKCNLFFSPKELMGTKELSILAVQVDPFNEEMGVYDISLVGEYCKEVDKNSEFGNKKRMDLYHALSFLGREVRKAKEDYLERRRNR